MKKGFTLVELLVALTIIGLLAGASVATFKGAREKAKASLVKQNLSSIRSTAEEVYFTSYPNTYLPVCFESMVDLILKDLGDATAVEDQDYQCLSSSDRWLAIFPLATGGYWCSDGLGRSLPVDGFVPYSSPEYMDCLLAIEPEPEVVPPPDGETGEPGGSTATPVITLSGASTVDLYSKSNNPFKGGAWHKFHEPGYSASDAFDGDISLDIVVVGPTLVSQGGPNSCKTKTYEMEYSVTNSGGNSASTATRTIIHHRCKQP